MDERLFRNIWYLDQELKWDDVSLFPYKRSVTLKIKEDLIEVICRGEGIKISNIKSVSMGKQGRDFINDWVKIDYGDGKTAYFADGNALGWGGIFGGTNRIFEAVNSYMKGHQKIKDPLETQRQKSPQFLAEQSYQEGDILKKENIEDAQIKATAHKNKTTALLLAVFFGFWTWIYTWEKDYWKFWIGLSITIITLGFGYIAFYVWAIVDVISRTELFYQDY